ncbi:MAG: hypothetical protein IPK88_18000 [Saprospiraceae bacterium]|nr:hypothetical protein [Candidatus Defluviibacterium haderslevense]
MKNIILLNLVFFLLLKNNCYSQNINCFNDGFASLQPQVTNCPFSEMAPEDIDNLPLVKVYINIHFINSSFGNFHPGTTPDNDPTNGNEYADRMILNANGILSNLQPNPIGNHHKLGDSKIRFELYSDPNNTNDVNHGVWYWDTEPTTLPYENVMNIIMYSNDDEDGDFNGYVYSINGCPNRAYLHGAYYNVINNGPFLWWSYGPLMCHEVFHTFGLCHSYSIDASNICKDVDINPQVECNKSAGHPDCGSGGGIYCNPWNSGSTNMMGNNGTFNSLTICQWGLAYNNLISRGCSHVDFCEPNNNPIEITVNTLWDKLKIVTQPVQIMPGATLTITCEARFSPTAYIEVRRGARLIVDGALLTNLCPSAWPGIQVWGNPNLDQPDPASNPGNATIAGIVRIINNATIQHAGTAISTGAWALGGAGWQYVGGVVYAENSNFINNKRAVEFLSYKFSNKSKFINCLFTEPDGWAGNSVGVTIWDCNGIVFNRNRFLNLDVAGIYGIDFGAIIVDHNQFRNLTTGIESYNTQFYKGNLEIGSEAFTPNYFKNNRRHIFCSSTTGLDKVNIINNDLFDAQKNGIILDGSSYYNVSKNRFMNTPLAMSSTASGFDGNFIRCNTFQSHTNGIKFEAYNEQTQFLDNCIESTVNTGIVLNVGTEIRYEQGGAGRPAGNCLQSALDISTNNSLAFNYFATPQPSLTHCSPTDNNCQRPTNNLSDGGSNNYFLGVGNWNGPNGCGNGGGDGLAPPTIVNARNLETTALLAWQQNPGDLSLKKIYNEMKLQTRNAIRTEIKNALATYSYQEAINLLIPNYSEFELNLAFAIRIQEGNFTEAAILLSNMPTNNQNEIWHKQIQAINLERAQLGSNYTLNNEQDQLLTQIMNSNSSERSFARSLLALLKGGSYAFDVLPTELPAEPRVKSQLKLENEYFRLSPNPAKDYIEVWVKNSNMFETLELVTLSGTVTQRQSIKGKSNIKFELSDCISGSYFIKAIDTDNKVLQIKQFEIIK